MKRFVFTVSIILTAIILTLWAEETNRISVVGGNAGVTVYSPGAAPEPVIRKIAGLGSSSLALNSDGLILAWGNNKFGQLGDGTTVNKSLPVQVKGISGVVAIAGGRSHSLALKKDGTVWAWGMNKSGQLGDGTTVNKSLPVQVKGISGVVAIAAGRSHSLALKKDGTVRAWGMNGNRQLGDGKTKKRTTPVQVKKLSGIVAIAAGAVHSLALKSDGTVWIWGLHKQGKPGKKKTRHRFAPVKVKKLSKIIGIACGYYHSLALKKNGTVWVWGKHTRKPFNIPTRVKGISGIIAIAGGYNRSLALKKDGTVWVWGNHIFAKPWKGKHKNRYMPLKVEGLANVAAIAAGRNHSLALNNDGSVRAWGNNKSGQLGDGTTKNRFTPVTVKIAPPVSPVPTVNIQANPTGIKIGESSTLTWSSTGAETCVIEPGIGSVAANGSVTVSPNENVTYTITAAGPGGTAAAGIAIEVTDPYTRVSLTASPAEIEKGESSTLTWTSLRAENVYIDNGIGAVEVNGSITLSPEHTTVYTVTASGPAGSAGSQVTIKVTGKPQPQPAGSFGDRYKDLIPQDATIDSYDTQRFALITGRVLDLENAPVPGVAVDIHGHPGYGTAETGADGRFTIPVEGGGTLTLVYRKKDRLTVNRKVNVPRGDIAAAETIKMIARDPLSTTLTLDGSPGTSVTHKGSQVTDEFGSRSCSVVFKGDNRVYALDKKGNVIHELSTITARATEYTAPQTMPARLPARSGFTYCVELEVDGIQQVKFEKPVITWVDNFLGFDVGMAVPVGYYDREKGAWVPSENGVVVRLLDTDGDGRVDALDAGGDNQADDLDGDGSFGSEVAGLDDPGKYAPGATFWRVEITHFTSWDCNWPYGPPQDAIPPQGLPQLDGQKEKNCDCPVPRNSYVEERSRIFHEDIAIPGTGLTLHYQSSRVPGYKHRVTIPAAGDSVPESLKSIIVKVDTAGCSFEKILEPLPNQKVEYTWDGLDSRGVPVTGSATAHVAVGYKYGAVYYSPGDFQRAFDQAGGDVTAVKARQEVILWNRKDIVFAVNKVASTIAEGWTLSNHHTLSPMDTSTLFKGDGSTLRHDTDIINVVAGTGEVGFSSGNGGPAIDARFRKPVALAVDAEGNYYISDTDSCHVRKVDKNGIITAFAGTGTYGYSGDGGPATAAMLKSVLAITVDVEGNVYLADKGNDRIRKVDTDGIITTFAGKSDTAGTDSGTALGAKLVLPYGLTCDVSGNFYIADWSGDYIRKIDGDGIITTIAGGNGAGFAGDGGPATAAKLYNPSGIVVDHLGNLYIADRDNHRVRKVDGSSGIITTAAGNGTPGYGGDGGPGTDAMLDSPSNLTVDASGNLYIADAKNNRIRKLDTNGIISTVAGTGANTFGGDGGPATRAGIPTPRGIVMDINGNLLLVDGKRVRMVASSSPFSGADGIGDTLFPDSNGLGYVVSVTGGHRSTIDLETGLVLQTFDYDDRNKLVSITDRFNNKVTIERDENGRPTAIVSADGIRTQLTLDTHNRLSSVTYPDGGIYQFEYSDDGLMLAEVEPNGNRFQQVFDDSGRLTHVSDDEGGDWTYTRTVNTDNTVLTAVSSAEGNSTSYLDHTGSNGAYTSTITGPSGATTEFSRSGDGLTVKKTSSCGMSHESSYQLDPQHMYKYIKEMKVATPAGLTMVTSREKTYEDTNSDKTPDRISEKITINEKTTISENDLLQSGKTLTSPEGRKMTVLYDTATLLIECVIVPGFYDIEYTYDEKGRLTSVHAGTRKSVFTYDEKGNLATVTDALQHTTSFRYDAIGRTVEIISPDNTSTYFSYDRNGNMTRLTNPAHKVHEFGFNQINRNTSYKTPLSGSYTYIYDRDRLLLETKSPSGKKIENVYENGRLKQVKAPEGNVDFTYLCGEKIGSISKRAETITYTYDGSLITAEALSGTLARSLAYGYNNDFDLVSFTYAGETASFGYDKDGLLTAAGDFTIGRNSENGRPEIIGGGNVNLVRTFNGYGEVEQQTFSVNEKDTASWTLTIDNAGRITTREETLNGAASNFKYTYDALGRLVTVAKDGVLAEEYRYNANGSRSYEMNTARGITGRTYTYSDEDHLLTAGPVSYQYDKDGFLTAKTRDNTMTTYQYSSTGELLHVTLPGDRNIEYVHDPMGRRIAKKVEGAIVEKYLWQDLTMLLAVYDGNDNLLMRFEYVDQSVPVTMTANGTVYYLAYDPVGSLRLVVDNGGNIVKKMDYDSFGNIINDTNPSFIIPFGFAGGMHDRDTGLVCFGFRDYDPGTGRWTGKDPILFAAGDTDLYGYCLNDPVNFIDPWGLSECKYGEEITQIMNVGPIDALQGYLISEDAKKSTNNSKFSGKHNGPGDAYRHCYWSCRMAQDIDLEQAKKIGETHESCGSNPQIEIYMDLYNNNVGRGYGTPGADCGVRCRNGVKRRKLQTKPYKRR